MNILITGADGFIGSRLMRVLQKQNPNDSLSGIDIHKSSWNDNLPIDLCDLPDNSAIRSFLKVNKPDTIVLNGAIKGLEQCQNSSIAYNVNVGSLEPFVSYTLQNPNVHLIYISSDMVFGGCVDSPFAENHFLCSANAYGQMKIVGEEIVKLVSRWSIVRTALVYGPLYEQERDALLSTLRQDTLDNQSLLIHWCTERTAIDKAVSLADNVFCTPTCIDDLTSGLSKIIRDGKAGVFHCSGSNRISRYELGLLATKYYGNPQLVRSFTSNRTAIRPLDVSLDNRKTIIELGIEPISIIDGIKVALLR